MARSTMNHIIKHLRLKLNDAIPTPLASNEYYKGDTIKLQNIYKNLSDVNTDPDTPTVTITDPNGTVTVDEATPTKSATGIYYYNYAPTAVEGWWTVEFGGSITGEATIWPDRFRVYLSEKFIWTDDELQVFLDLHRRRLNRVKLDVDQDWQVFEARFTLLEGSTVTWSGAGDAEDVINIWDRPGRDATFKTPTSYNLTSGTLSFDSEQTEQPYYLDAISYNIAGAIAEAMEQLAMDPDKATSWSRGGVSYTFQDFMEMGKQWRKMVGTDKGRLV